MTMRLWRCSVRGSEKPSKIHPTPGALEGMGPTHKSINMTTGLREFTARIDVIWHLQSTCLQLILHFVDDLPDLQHNFQKKYGYKCK